MELIQSFLGNFIECEESNDSVIGGIVDLGLAAMRNCGTSGARE
jgi:hypothetical protein